MDRGPRLEESVDAQQTSVGREGVRQQEGAAPGDGVGLTGGGRVADMPDLVEFGEIVLNLYISGGMACRNTC